MTAQPKPWHDLRPDAQAFDEVRIVTVPRFKQSGLSGDEWRISAKVTFYRKGNAVHEESMRDVETACNLLGWLHIKACETGHSLGGDDSHCDQEGCSELATVTYRKVKDGCGRCGHVKPTSSGLGGGVTIRRFCERHRRRGDSSLDDSDDNYELMP